jgi:hypothetical protein
MILYEILRMVEDRRNMEDVSRLVPEVDLKRRRMRSDADVVIEQLTKAERFVSHYDS